MTDFSYSDCLAKAWNDMKVKLTIRGTSSPVSYIHWDRITRSCSDFERFIVRNLFTLPEHTRLTVDIQSHGRKIVQKALNQAKSKEFLAN